MKLRAVHGVVFWGGASWSEALAAPSSSAKNIWAFNQWQGGIHFIICPALVYYFFGPTSHGIGPWHCLTTQRAGYLANCFQSSRVKPCVKDSIRNKLTRAWEWKKSSPQHICWETLRKCLGWQTKQNMRCCLHIMVQCLNFKIPDLRKGLLSVMVVLSHVSSGLYMLSLFFYIKTWTGHLIQVRLFPRSQVHVYAGKTVLSRPEKERKIQLCIAVLEALGKVDPGYTKWRGTLLQELIHPLMLISKVGR